MERGWDFMKAVARDRALIGQLVRYGISGGGVTAFGALAYWLLAKPAHLPGQAANALSWVLAVCLGYAIHSSWSFRGHGTRSDPARIRVRFLTVAVISLLANALWVFTFTRLLHGPTWSPIPAMCVVTPLITFPLNRRWVFG